MKTIIIFDDYVCEKNQRQIVDYFIEGRHKNCSVIYRSQSFYKTPRDIRLFSQEMEIMVWLIKN